MSKNRVTMEYLASELNMSKTTVSKALNNCPGISSTTKNAVFKTAESYGYTPVSASKDVAVVLPSVPDFFWGKMRKLLSLYAKAADISCKFYVYHDLNNPFDAFKCLQDAINEKVSVIIVACPESAEIKKLLESISSDILVILLEEFSDIKNAFFVGENSFYEGYTIAKQYISEHPMSKSFLIAHTSILNTKELRVEGFKKALGEYNIKDPMNLSTDSKSTTQSADFARKLSTLKSLPGCIFCPSGNISKIALAVKKLKADSPIHCIGFDINTEKNTDFDKEFIKNTVIQNIDAQTKCALECTENFLRYGVFPNSKNIYVPSVHYNINTVD